MQAVPDSEPTVVMVTTIVSHDFTSTSPAFNVQIQAIIPRILELTLPFVLEVNGRQNNIFSFSTSEDGMTFIQVTIEQLPLHEDAELTYFAQLSPENTRDGTFSTPVIVNFTTTRAGSMVKG